MLGSRVAAEPVAVCDVGATTTVVAIGTRQGALSMCARFRSGTPRPPGSADALMALFQEIMPSTESTRTGTRQRAPRSHDRFAGPVCLGARDRCLSVRAARCAAAEDGAGDRRGRPCVQSSRFGRKRARCWLSRRRFQSSQIATNPAPAMTAPRMAQTATTTTTALSNSSRTAAHGTRSPVFRPAAADCYLYRIAFSLDLEAAA